jgi:CheY-like chemotaxis protein
MTAPAPVRPILLIDDSHEDLFLAKRLFARAGVTVPIITIDQGEEGLAFLRAMVANGPSPLLPRIVFCDVRMPGIGGFAILEWARDNGLLALTKFVMLTGGDTLQDRRRAAELGAHEFVVKFPAPDVLQKLIASVS